MIQVTLGWRCETAHFSLVFVGFTVDLPFVYACGPRFCEYIDILLAMLARFIDP